LHQPRVHRCSFHDSQRYDVCTQPRYEGRYTYLSLRILYGVLTYGPHVSVTNFKPNLSALMPRRPSPTIGNPEANATSIHRVADPKVQSRTNAKDQNWQNHEERGTTGNSNREHKHAALGTEVEAEAREVLRLELLVCFFFFSFLFFSFPFFHQSFVILLSSQALQRPQGRDGRKGYNSPTVARTRARRQRQIQVEGGSGPVTSTRGGSQQQQQ
jgi:hypothetical protein